MTASPARRWWRRAALAALLTLVALATLVVVQARRRPDLAPYSGLQAPAATATDPVRVRYAGVATLVFDDGQTAWMTDGFFSRPPALRTIFGSIAPDTARIDAALSRLGVTRLAAVVPVHSHYDHAMDAPAVAQRTGAVLVGGVSTLHIGRGAGLPDNRMRLVAPGETVQLGGFTLRFIASRHSPTPFSDGHTRETIDAPFSPPAHATRWREGDVWSIVVTHASGGRYLVQGSAGHVPGALAGMRADTVFLGTGTLGKKDTAYRDAYWREVVQAVGARRVVPIHWDDFSLPLEAGLQPSPYLLDDFDVVMRDLRERGARDGVAIALPPLFTPFRP